jgi:hypothetical protein
VKLIKQTGAAMKKSLKAALFSGLIFPGAGHFLLRHYLRGMIFFVPSLISFVFIADNSKRKAWAIVDKIVQGEVPLDLQSILSLVSASTTGPEAAMLNTAQWIMTLCWVISVIDSYRLGNIADQSDKK